MRETIPITYSSLPTTKFSLQCKSNNVQWNKCKELQLTALQQISSGGTDLRLATMAAIALIEWALFWPWGDKPDNTY